MEVAGFVLAGGKSSRMGRDKALLELGGKTLAAHAVKKLGRLCAEVSILGSDPELEQYAPLVKDVHADCGPMSGVEAALLHSAHDWNLILPVDVPFVPTVILNLWLGTTLSAAKDGARLSVLAVDAKMHPALLIIHREMAQFLTYSLERGHYRLLAALEYGAEKIAIQRNLKMEQVFLKMQYDDPSTPAVDSKTELWQTLTLAQRDRNLDWFSNVNTPEEFAEAERHVDALDTE